MTFCRRKWYSLCRLRARYPAISHTVHGGAHGVYYFLVAVEGKGYYAWIAGALALATLFGFLHKGGKDAGSSV